MKRRTHPINGLFVTSRFRDKHEVVRVERMTRTRSGEDMLVVRTHGGPDILYESADPWDAALKRYNGRRKRISLATVERVWPGPNEAWVKVEDFLAWAQDQHEQKEAA